MTHFWKELTESYARRKAADLKRPFYRLQLHDWGYLKGEQGWGRFADLFVNSNLHIILCGRAGYEFDLTLDDEGHKQLEKTGIKMKAESDFGYEPSLLVWMKDGCLRLRPLQRMDDLSPRGTPCVITSSRPQFLK